MPPVSQAQRGAMFAAKAGRSTIGIPKDVGAEFAAADPGGTLPKRVPGKKKKGKKLALKKKAKRPAPPMRRPAPMADDAGWAGDDGGNGY